MNISTTREVFADPGKENRKQLFLVEKTYNNENIMVVHATIDNECNFIDGKKLIDYYWLMDGKKEKRVHPMIKNKVGDRFKFNELGADKKSFTIQMADLSEVKHDLPDINIRVTSEKEKDGNCKVLAVLKLGPSGDNKELILERTFCVVKKNIVGVPIGCKTLELIGKDLKTGEELRVKFAAR